MDPVIALGLQVVFTLAAAAAVEVPVALRITRPAVRKDTAAAIAKASEQLRADLVADLKPGALRGGHDPQALLDAKAQRAEDRRIAATKAQVEVKTFLGERLGERGVVIANTVLGEDTMQAVYDSGSRWMETLGPFLNKLPAQRAQANGQDAARSEPAFAFRMDG